MYNVGDPDYIGQGEYMKPETMEAVLKALADRTRLRILGLLATGEVCVCHLHESLRLPQPTVSRHLAYLRRAGLVSARKDGLWAHYRIDAPSDRALRTLVETVTHLTTHLSTAAQDRRRLEKAIGCCVDDSATDARGLSCCP